MKHRKRIEWTKLDNASKIFPATSNEKDTKVFRLGCELYEPVVPEILQHALKLSVESFPFYKSVLRRGVFWYYFESSDIKPEVLPESSPVCAPIYIREQRNLLFRVLYFNNRIILEIFHALSDGTGALTFLQTLVYNYILLKYKDNFLDKKPGLNYSASISEKMDDSFGRYFEGQDIIELVKGNAIMNIKSGEKNPRAYHIHGSKNDENRMNLIEGSMSVKDVLNEAHQYNTTLTIFISSLFVYSIIKEMPARRKRRPLVLSVPINLRQFFQSETVRNFFSTMHVSFDAGNGNNQFREVVQSISQGFRNELTEEQLRKQLNQLISLEKNILARAIPLPLKDYSLRIANKLKDRGITAAISNLGRITMPAEFDPYIRQFSFSTSARRPQICMCSYGDRLVVTFTSPFRETEIQRNFFEFLSDKGIDIEISSNF